MIASLLAVRRLLASLATRNALFLAALRLCFCLRVVRLLAELVSTPMSTPALPIDIGIPILLQHLAKDLVALLIGTALLFGEI